MTASRREMIVGAAATAVASGAMVMPGSAENILLNAEIGINAPSTISVNCACSFHFRSADREFSAGPSLPPGAYAVDICADDAWFAVRKDGSVIGDPAVTLANLETMKERFPSVFVGADSWSLMFATGIVHAILSAA